MSAMREGASSRVLAIRTEAGAESEVTRARGSDRGDLDAAVIVASIGSTEPTYVPFLKGKAGEFEALEQLEAEQREPIMPLFDVPPEKVEFKILEDEKVIQIDTVDEALDGYAARVAKAWPATHECFVDLAGFDPEVRLLGGAHPVTRFFADATELSAIPVTGLDRDAAQVEAVRRVCAASRRGAAIRLRRSALVDPAALADQVLQLVERLEIDPPNLDLLLDFGELVKGNVEETAVAARAAIRALPDLLSWRRLIFATGAFPFELGPQVGAEQTKALPRYDWQLWRQLVSASEAIPRLLTYGDYGATYADWKEAFDPTAMSVSAKVVYTTEDQWVIAKGVEKVKKNGPQYHGLCRRLKERSEFLEADHCESEAKILQCAEEVGGPGGSKEWVTVATRHHLEMVSRQLASPS